MNNFKLASRNYLAISALVAVMTGVFIYNVMPAPLKSRAAALIQGDINGDGKVDIFDLSILLANFGKSVNPTPSPTATATPPPGSTGLPAGVSLKAIDGGSNYYCSHGFTSACNGGWDNPGFFPIGPWYGNILTQSDVNRWHDLGLNTAYRVTGSSSLALMKASGLWAIISPGEAVGTPGSETVGLLTEDEPPDWNTAKNAIGTTSNSLSDGRFWYINNTWNFIYYGGLSGLSGGSPAVLSTLVSTPNGSKRHIDIQSADIYWFAGARSQAAGISYGGKLIYGLGSDMTPDQAARGSHYGDMVDSLRQFQTANPAPIANFVENGGPYTEDKSASYYVTPEELNAGVWDNIIHGARQIIYFNHTFAGPASSDDNLAQSYYQTVQPGQSTSIYAQTKATDALVQQLAPVINSATAVGYATVNPSGSFPSLNGFDVMAKYYNNTSFYIFAEPRTSESQANQATFTTADHYSGPVTVVNENRTVQATNGVFTDRFANGSTVHIYKIH